MVILEFDFKSLKDKIVYSIVSPIQKVTKNVRKGGKEAVSSRSSSSERESCFSLEIHAI